MKYQFIRMAVTEHSSGWYLVVDNLEVIMDLQKSVGISMFMKYGKDPHYFNQKTGEALNAYSYFCSPVKLAGNWSENILKRFFEFGKVYVNRNHGMIFGDQNHTILDEINKDKLIFPSDDEHKKGIKIKICKYGDGVHYYLSANQTRIWSQPKFNDANEALAEARQHAFEKNISFSDRYVYSKIGD